jgi:tetratricopeptide (TPR) repeat protein
MTRLSRITPRRWGVAYKSTGQYDQAISDYTKALEINPRYALAYYNRALAYENTGQYDKAWEDVDKAQDLGFKINPQFLKALRKASRRQKKKQVSPGSILTRCCPPSPTGWLRT